MLEPCSCRAGRSCRAPADVARPASDRAEQRVVQRGDADQAGARVGADHRAHLRHELGRPAVDRLAALGQPLRLVGGLDVLDEEAVLALLAQRAEVVDQALERAAARCARARSGRSPTRSRGSA